MDHRIILEQVVGSLGLETAGYHGYWVAAYQSNEPLPETLKGSPQVSVAGDGKWTLSYLAPTPEEATAQLNHDLRNWASTRPSPS
jgi:hypothetical protein